MSDSRLYPHISALNGEAPLRSEVRVERGGPRLFVNDREEYPLAAWSWSLEASAGYFRSAGVRILHPILGLQQAWSEDAPYDWSRFDLHFENLLRQHPEALFLPRIHLDVPDWWRERHPQELITCGVAGHREGNQYWDMKINPEGGFRWGIELDEPSFASEIWRADMEKLLRGFLRHIEASPLQSRMVGYQIGSGIYGEWHYFVSEFVPDFSRPAVDRLGPIPTMEERLHTSYGLLRDPEQESDVIDHYRSFHEILGAGTLLHFARIVKEETKRRVICGAFYGYQLENVYIHEGGHLAPEVVLRSQDIDFLASPYSYQATNLPDRPRWEHDVYDDAGNFLGRTRGIAGDGGYRVMLESLRRAGKLFFVEMDASTYVEPDSHNATDANQRKLIENLLIVGGKGCTTPEGTRRILERDLGQMFARGNGGWLFDFGPVLQTGRSWYAEQPVIDLVRSGIDIGSQRTSLDIGSCAQIAAVYSASSYFVTRHWLAESPFRKGGKNLDFFSLWFADSQVRSLHRIGAPVDFLYDFDVGAADAHRYDLLICPNLFLQSNAEVDRLRDALRDSGTTVIWMYAPAFVDSAGLSVERMERLTGFTFEIVESPGSFLIDCELEPDTNRFGIADERWPRFVVGGGKTWGRWSDNGQPAMAVREMDGWTSIYVGTAPLPAPLLRSIAARSGVALWSDQPDIVAACEDAAMIVATASGPRTITFPKDMYRIGDNVARQSMELTSQEGDVYLFAAKPIP